MRKQMEARPVKVRRSPAALTCRAVPVCRSCRSFGARTGRYLIRPSTIIYAFLIVTSHWSVLLKAFFVRRADDAVRKTGDCRAKDSVYSVVGHRRSAGYRGGD